MMHDQVHCELHIVYEPEHRPDTTIIAVHGIAGDWEKTWTTTDVSGSSGSRTPSSRTPNAPNFWLRDQLPAALPQCGILSFDYSLLPGSSSLEDPVKELACCLLQEIEFGNWEKSRNQTAPIPSDRDDHKYIFLAHGIGGIIVKRALIESRKSSLWRYISDNTLGIMFFGTPHRVHLNQEIFDKLWPADSSQASAEQPKKIQRVLEDTNEGFCHIAGSFSMIVSVYETLLTTDDDDPSEAFLVVNAENAQLQTQNEDVFPGDSTHADLVRLTEDSQTYKRTLKALSNMISNGQGQRSRPPSAPGQTSPNPGSPLPNGGGKPAHSPERFKLWLHVHERGGGVRYEKIQMGHLWNLGPRSCMRRFFEPWPDPSGTIWAHVPVNNTSWVHPSLRSIATELGSDLTITHENYWNFNERRRRDNLAHSRYMQPSCHYSSGNIGAIPDTDSRVQVAIYMPYLHWDTVKAFKRRAEFIKDISRMRMASAPEQLSTTDRDVYSAMRRDMNGAVSFHPRRSLDQYFYSRLSDTSPRDEDQVVSRENKRRHEEARMIMVDQLWLWIVEDHGPGKGAAVFTCFPAKEKASDTDNRSSIADLRQAVLDGITGQKFPTNSATYLAGVILEKAVNVMLQNRNEPSIDFLELFREAIGNASEKQTRFFRQFHRRLDGDNRINYWQQKPEEVKLLFEVEDIIDELNTITHLLEAQRDTLRNSVKKIKVVAKDVQEEQRPHWENLVYRLTELANTDVTDYLIQVKRMMKDAQRTRKSLLGLLDLQQKEANLAEAQASNESAVIARKQAELARKQADEAGAQSVIILLFTIVTVVFTPLSFFTSYFGMNVSRFTGEEGNLNLGYVQAIMWPASAGIYIMLGIAAFFGYGYAKQNIRKTLGEITGIRVASLAYLKHPRKHTRATPGESDLGIGINASADIELQTLGRY